MSFPPTQTATGFRILRIGRRVIIKCHDRLPPPPPHDSSSIDAVTVNALLLPFNVDCNPLSLSVAGQQEYNYYYYSTVYPPINRTLKLSFEARELTTLLLFSNQLLWLLLHEYPQRETTNQPRCRLMPPLNNSEWNPIVQGWFVTSVSTIQQRRRRRQERFVQRANRMTDRRNDLWTGKSVPTSFIYRNPDDDVHTLFAQHFIVHISVHEMTVRRGPER